MANVVEVVIRGIDEATRVFESVGKTAEQSMSSAKQSVDSLDDSLQNISDLEISTTESENALNSVEQSVNDVDEAVENVTDLDIETDSAEASLNDVETTVSEINTAVESIPDLDIDSSGAITAVEEVNESLNQATESVQTFSDRASESFKNVSDKWMEITAVAGTAGVAIESMGSKQKDLTEQTERVAQALGTTSDEIRNSALEITNVTFPIEDVLDLMETGRQQGIKSVEQLKEYALFWDMVGDATGLAGPELGKASSGLRAVGIAAGEEKEALAAFGYITENTTSDVGEFLRFLERTGPQLNEMGMDVNDAAAMLGILEHEFGMSGRTARQEFRKAVNEADGDMNKLMETLGISNSVFEQYKKAVADSSDVIERNADIHAESYTVMDKLQQKASELMYQYGDLIGVASNLAPVLMGIGPALKGFTEAKQLATKAAKGFNLALRANPIGIVITIIGALIAILWTLFGDWETVSEFLSSSWEWIKNVAEEVFGAIGEAISSAWQWISEVTSEIWNGIKEFFTEYWDLLLAAIFGPVGFLVRTIIKNWDEIKETTAVIWEAVKEFFVTIFETISEVFNTFTETVAEIWNTVWETAKEVVETIWNGILEFFTWIWEEIKNVFSTTIETIQNAIQTAWDWITNITNSIWNGISGFFTDIWDTISNVFTTSVDRAKDIITSAWDNIKRVTENVFGRIRDFFSNIWDRITNGVENMKDRFIDAWNGITDGVKSAVNVLIGLINGAISGIEGMVNSVARAVNSLPSFDIPDWVPIVGGRTFGLPNIPTISLPRVPALAEGGIVTRETMALIGEGGDHEAVIPLNNKVMAKLGAMIGDNIKGRGDSIDYRKLAEAIVALMDRGSSGGDAEITIEVPVNIDSREVGRIVAPHVDRLIRRKINAVVRARGGG